jgi:mono/diheme cytochrome c family protein
VIVGCSRKTAGIAVTGTREILPVRCTLRWSSILGLLLLVVGCGGYDGPESNGAALAAESGGASPAQGATAALSAEASAFAATVHPLVEERCGTCHSGMGPGFPSLAAEDPELAMDEVTTVVDFETLTESRIVLRLSQDLHYCWTDCISDGLEMLGAIVSWQTLLAMEAAGQTGSQEGALPAPAALEIEVPDVASFEATAPLTVLALQPPATSGGNPPVAVAHDGPDGFPVGAVSVEWTAVDADEVMVSVIQQIVVADTTPPLVVPPPAIITNATGALTLVNLGIASAEDLVSGVVAVNNDAPASFSVGTTSVVWSATDAAGNVGSATQLVTVNAVASAALRVTAPPPVAGEATGSLTAVAVGQATSSGGQAPVVVTNDAPAGGFLVGDHVVRWTAQDAANQTSVATQQVRILDTTAPAIVAPGDLSVTADGERTSVALGQATASDIADSNVGVTNDAPQAGLELGFTIVTWTARDASGNTATASQLVTVNPGELTLTPPAPRSLEAMATETVVDIGVAEARGGVPPLVIENDAPAGGFPLGEHVVTWSVRDQQGETRSATQSVRISDTMGPLLTAPPDVSVEAETVPVAVDLGSAQAADLSGSAVEIRNDAPAAGFPLGTTTVVWAATDAIGNSSTAVQSVTVLLPVAVVGDPAAGAQLYATNCGGCHGAEVRANVFGILSGVSAGAIENALRSVPAMQAQAFLLDQPQALADLAAYIAEEADASSPVAEACQLDQDPMQPGALLRLSKLQYTNTLRDMLRERLAPATANAIMASLDGPLAGIPDDEVPGTFANFDQRVSTDHVEGFLSVAMALADGVAASDARLVDFVGEGCAVNAGDSACRERFVERFGAEALRHPLSVEEVSFYSDAADYGELIARLLMAPGFLSIEQYRGSQDASDPSRLVLSPYELASKLAYHFWQTKPDDALIASATSGEIETSYEAVVARVFSDPRTRLAMSEFFAGWLRVNEIPEFALSKPERENFLATDYGNGTSLPRDLDLASYRRAAIAEVLALAEFTTFERDGTFGDLFTSRDSFASDPQLARAYGVAQWPGGSSPPIPFGAAQSRSGLVSRAALQMYGDFRSHPILKGARVRMELLCDGLMVPAEVETPEDAVIHPDFSTRELTEAITQIEGTTCVGCHEPLINPLGFPTESFDAVGRSRSAEVLFDETGNERFRAPVDTRTTPRIESNSTETVNDAVELGELLAASPKASACFARHYYRFSQRRMEVDASDRCELDALDTALQASGLQGMLKAVALLPEFKLRSLPE